MIKLGLYIQNECGDMATDGDSIQVYSVLPYANGYCGLIRQIDADGTIHFQDGMCVNSSTITEFYLMQC